MRFPSSALNQIDLDQITFISGSELSYVLHVSCITIVSYKEVLIGVLFKHKHSFPYPAIQDKYAFATDFISVDWIDKGN